MLIRILLCTSTLFLPFRLGAQERSNTFPTFRSQTIDAHIGNICYAVTLADVDGDSKQDIVAVSENRVVWYQNPTWTPQVIIADQTPKDNVTIAPYDIDGDGKIDFAVGAGWTNANTGTIHWVSRNPTLDEKWNVYSIGQERWLHRMRWADVLNKGRAQLVISPLTATTGKGVQLMAFEVPGNPVQDRWPSTLLDGELNRMHNHWHVDFDRDGVIDTLTASQEGVHVIRRLQGQWTKTKIGSGATSNQPNLSGAGEIKIGRMKNGKVFIATIEPMHGNMLVVYTPSDDASKLWDRHTIDEGFARGHGLWIADMDGDGTDDIVFGHSDTPLVPGVNVYRATDESATRWEKYVVDAGGVATEDLIVADLTGDGRPDIVAGGRATHNVVLYINVR